MSLPNVWTHLLRRATFSRRRQQTLRKPACKARSFVPRLEFLEDRTVLSTLTVTNPADSGDGSLRAAIAVAQSGDQIVFDTNLKGQTITLTSGPLAITQSIDIEGPGAGQLAVSGNHASRVFAVNGGVTVIIAGLTISDGMVVGGDGGGGILNMGSTLTLANDVLANNQVLSDLGGAARGGALGNLAGATLTVTNSLFSHNQAQGSSGGSPANGGGIVNSASRLIISHSTFMGNQALGGDGGGNALGGAILINQSGVATVSDSTFTGNLAKGGDGGVVGGAITAVGTSQGGAILNDARLTVSNSTFTGNQATAGNGGNGGSGTATGLVDVATGGGVRNNPGRSLVLSGSTFADNQASGGSNATAGTNDQAIVGVSPGGGLYNGGTVTITDTTFEHNQSRGGNGNIGGGGAFCAVGIGGAIANSGFAGLPATLTARNLTIRDNVAIGGTGNTTRPLNPGIEVPGTAEGGGMINTYGLAMATLSDSTISDNQALGAQGGAGGNGSEAWGGGIVNRNGASLSVSACALADNQAVGGAAGTGGNGGNGFGGGIYNEAAGLSRLTVLGSTLTNDEARGGAAGAAGTSAGLGAGGGIWSAGILEILDSQLAHNQAQGGNGTSGANAGNGFGGGLSVTGGTAILSDTTLGHNQALGGNSSGGGNGGNGSGGGVYVDAAGTVIVTTSDITRNLAGGGRGADGGTDGQGVGGGVYNLGTFVFDIATLITGNHASTSNDDGFGY